MKFVTLIVAKRVDNSTEIYGVIHFFWQLLVALTKALFSCQRLSALPVFQLSLLCRIHKFVCKLFRVPYRLFQTENIGTTSFRTVSTQQLRPIKQPQNGAVVIWSEENVMQWIFNCWLTQIFHPRQPPPKHSWQLKLPSKRKLKYVRSMMILLGNKIN